MISDSPVATSKSPVLRRKNPDDRIDDILRIAERQISDGGLLALSMQSVGTELGTSRTLIYSYFRDQNALVSAILEDKFTLLINQGLIENSRRHSLVESILNSAGTYLQHVIEYGPIIHDILRDAAEIELDRNVLHPFRTILRNLARQTRHELSLNSQEALALVEMLAAIPEELGRLARSRKISAEQAEMLCRDLLVDSLEALRP